MGRHSVGEECCNNCTHWRPEYERQLEGRPPKTCFCRSSHALGKLCDKGGRDYGCE